MCKPNGKAGIPATCPRRGDCRGCRMLLSAMAGEQSASRLDVLVKEVRPLPAPVFLETCLKFGNPMPIPKNRTL